MKSLSPKYQSGEFTLRIGESLRKNCNAPNDQGGIYIVTDVRKNQIIYIGSSGWLCQNGDFKIRKGGMCDRIVNGKQFEKPRSISWLLKMQEQNIPEIKVNWFVTFNFIIQHIPAFVEACLLQEFFEANKFLPLWNTDF